MSWDCSGLKSTVLVSNRFADTREREFVDQRRQPQRCQNGRCFSVTVMFYFVSMKPWGNLWLFWHINGDHCWRHGWESCWCWFFPVECRSSRRRSRYGWIGPIRAWRITVLRSIRTCRSMTDTNCGRRTCSSTTKRMPISITSSHRVKKCSKLT